MGPLESFNGSMLSFNFKECYHLFLYYDGSFVSLIPHFLIGLHKFFLNSTKLPIKLWTDKALFWDSLNECYHSVRFEFNKIVGELNPFLLSKTVEKARNIDWIIIIEWNVERKKIAPSTYLMLLNDTWYLCDCIERERNFKFECWIQITSTKQYIKIKN